MIAFELSPQLAYWAGALAIASFVAGLILVPILVVRMPADYFTRARLPDKAHGGHPVARIVLRVLRNALAAVLVAAGIAMLVLPGQGVLTILIGLTLADFPGKRRLEIAIIRRKPIAKVMAWMRERAGKPPLELPDPGAHG